MLASGNADFIEYVEKYPFFNFLEEFMKNWCYFFLKCLVKVATEAMWALSFPCGKSFNYKSDFHNGYVAVGITYI